MNRLRMAVWIYAMLASLASLSIAHGQVRAGRESASGDRPVRMSPNNFIVPIDIRVVIACRDAGEHQAAQVLSQRLAPIVDAIASGAKLTKADAARMGVPDERIDEIDDFRDWFLSVLTRHPGRGVYVFSVTPPQTSAKQSVSGCPQGCLPPDCFCYRFLDYDPVVFSPIDSEDPTFNPPPGWFGGSSGGNAGGSSGGGAGSGAGGGSGSGSGGSGAGGGSGSAGGSGGAGGGRIALNPSRPIVILVFDRPGVTREQTEKLVRETLLSLQSQSLTGRLVIRTRSACR